MLLVDQPIREMVHLHFPVECRRLPSFYSDKKKLTDNSDIM